MKGALDPGPVVVAEVADVGNYVFELGLGDLGMAENDLPPGVARFGKPPKVEEDFKQVGAAGWCLERLPDRRRQGLQ